jgi:putative nucleotidyltransferase with HDIG domain
MIDRKAALTLLAAQNPEPGLLAHSLQTEAVMAALAAHLGQDVALWSLTGLLHDLDYPRTKEAPACHGLLARESLVGALPEEALRAIAAHNDECTGVPPETPFEFALRAAESVTGIISANALVRPEGMAGMSPKSVKKKMKDKAFAANVRRDSIRECDKAGVPLDTFLTLAIDAMAAMDQPPGQAG